MQASNQPDVDTEQTNQQTELLPKDTPIKANIH